MLLQDNICTSGLRTTAGSRVLDSYLPPFDATTVAKLRAAGAVLIGKTNMDEFGMGSTTENSAYKVTQFPCLRRRCALLARGRHRHLICPGCGSRPCHKL